ncbi:RING-H2 finger protein ATL66-like [Silene latifolia]|uniref:RING-H2 finger protein ATL66-like n=1 Tax=Silene latifolia TaxID=37657 RepID=UPI003D76F4C5
MAFYLSRRHLNHQPSLTTEDNSGVLHWHYAEMDDKNFQIHGRTLFYLFILFSIILLATLLLLYARWFFRFRHHHASATHISHYNATHAPPTRSKGLDMLVIKAMPIILHQGSAVEREDEMECCICLGVFDDGDKVKVLNECNHRFHSDCVDRWLIGQATCPLCRLSLKPPPPSSDLQLAQVV